MDVVFDLTLQCNSPVFSYSTKNSYSTTIMLAILPLMVVLFYHSINVSTLSPSLYQDPDRILPPVVWCHSHSILIYSPSTLIHTAAVHCQRALHWVPCREEAIALQYKKSDLGLLLESGHHVPPCFYLVSRGKKSMVLFKSGKRMAEALMTSVGFGVTRPRTCCFR